MRTLSDAMKVFFGLLIVLSTWVFKLAVIYLVSAVVTYVVCWAFGLVWTLKVPVGALVIYLLIIGGVRWQLDEANKLRD